MSHKINSELVHLLTDMYNVYESGEDIAIDDIEEFIFKNWLILTPEAKTFILECLQSMNILLDRPLDDYVHIFLTTYSFSTLIERLARIAYLEYEYALYRLSAVRCKDAQNLLIQDFMQTVSLSDNAVRSMIRNLSCIIRRFFAGEDTFKELQEWNVHPYIFSSCLFQLEEKIPYGYIDPEPYPGDPIFFSLSSADARLRYGYNAYLAWPSTPSMLPSAQYIPNIEDLPNTCSEFSKSMMAFARKSESTMENYWRNS